MIDPVAETFVARPLVDCVRRDEQGYLTELRGSFLVAHGLIATAVTVPGSSRAGMNLQGV